MKVKLCLGALFLLLTMQLSWGQIPQTISYQGVLTDADDTPLDGHFMFTFRLYEQAEGSSAIWEENQQVEVVNGLFNVILGSVNPLTGTFKNPCWLGITVNEDSELTPRTELTASPYSLIARTIADSAVTGASIADGHLVRSINSIADEVTLSAGDHISITEDGNTITISSTGGEDAGNTLDQAYDEGGPGAGRTIVADAGSVTIEGEDGLTVAGKVGVGTTTPAEKLDVAGNAKISGSLEIGDQQEIRNSSGDQKIKLLNLQPGIEIISESNVSINIDTDSDEDDDIFQVTYGTDKIPGLLMSHAGDVGIGTTSPDSKLDVAGTAQMLGFKLPTGANDGYILTSDVTGLGTWQPLTFTLALPFTGTASSDVDLFTVSQNGSARAGLFQIVNPNNNSSALTAGTDGLGPAFTASHNGSGDIAVFQSNGYARVTISHAGKVGIGTETPLSLLDVAGAIHQSATAPTTILFHHTNESGTPDKDGFRLRYDQDFFGDTDDALIVEKTDGNQPDPDGGMAFVNTGSDGVVETAMVIKGDGNIGIGTENPSTLLDVAGTVAMTGFELTADPAEGYVLTADGSGVGTWQPLGNGLSLPFSATVSSPSDLFAIFQEGTGRAALFEITNADNSNPALHANTKGIGNALLANHEGPSGNIVEFKSHGDRKFSVDKEGNLWLTGSLDIADGEKLFNNSNNQLIRLNNDQKGIEIESKTNLSLHMDTDSVGEDVFQVTHGDDKTVGLLMDKDGLVGIGTTSPTTALDINGQIRIRGGAPGRGKVLVSDAQGKGFWKDVPVFSDGDWTISGDDMFSAVTGNVGIGTRVPAEKLEVAGNIQLSSDAPALSFEEADIPVFWRQIISGDQWLLQREQADFFIVTNAADVVVKGNISNNEDEKFRINAAADDASLRLQTQGHDRVTVQADGRVGVGISRPRQKLDIAGKARMTGIQLTTNPVAGHVLTSDARGFGTWQPLPGTNGTATSWSLIGNSDTVPGTNFVGTTDNQALELHVNSSRALRLEPNATSPNVIGGFSGNAITRGVYGGTIAGGGTSAGVNLITDNGGTVGGGANNQTGNSGVPDDSGFNTISGGYGNTASGAYAAIGGGMNNSAIAEHAAVGGGMGNVSEGDSASFVGGGIGNTAGGSFSAITGGLLNSANGRVATVAGGEANSALGAFSLAAGRFAKANHRGSFVWSDASAISSVDSFYTTTDNQFLIRASGGVGIGTNSPSEALDVAGNLHASGMITSGSSIVIDGSDGRNNITSTTGTLVFDDENLVTAGTVESTSGGFKFPDGTIQMTAASGGTSSWLPLTLEDDFSNLGDAWQTAQVRKIGDIVYLRGAIQKSKEFRRGDVIAVLPTEFRPPADLLFLAASIDKESAAQLVVASDGKISVHDYMSKGKTADLSAMFFSISP